MFAPELAGLDRKQVREWYNGYRWRGGEKVYNPYDVLLLLRGREFDAHWFETGTPAFLVDTLFERRVSSVSLGEMVSTGELLSAFDVDHIGTEALLFQTGYLTITGEERLGGKALYRLGYPNREVRQSLNEYLLLVQDSGRQMANTMRLARLLETHDCAGLEELFHAFFASAFPTCAAGDGFGALVVAPAGPSGPVVAGPSGPAGPVRLGGPAGPTAPLQLANTSTVRSATIVATARNVTKPTSRHCSPPERLVASGTLSSTALAAGTATAPVDRAGRCRPRDDRSVEIQAEWDEHGTAGGIDEH